MTGADKSAHTSFRQLVSEWFMCVCMCVYVDMCVCDVCMCTHISMRISLFVCLCHICMYVHLCAWCVCAYAYDVCAAMCMRGVCICVHMVYVYAGVCE